MKKTALKVIMSVSVVGMSVLGFGGLTNDGGHISKVIGTQIAEASTTYYTTSALNLRKGAGTGYAKITTIPKNASVTYLGKSGSWYKVKYGNSTGYVSSSYLSTKKASSSTSSSKQTVQASSSTTYYTTSAVNLRKGAGTNHAKITTIPKNASVTYLGKSGSWYKVQYGKSVGYVSSSYVSSKKSTSTSSSSSSSSSSSVSSTKYQPYSIYFNGKRVSYQNGGQAKGQSIIDTTNSASTWGGTQTWSGDDGLSTHFIGHNNKQFAGITSAKTIVVTDGYGNPTSYGLVEKVLVDDYGKMQNGTERYWNIVGVGNREQIVIQTCSTSDWNWILFLVKQ